MIRSSGDYCVRHVWPFVIRHHSPNSLPTPTKRQRLAISLDGPHSFMLFTICAQYLAMAITVKGQWKRWGWEVTGRLTQQLLCTAHAERKTDGGMKFVKRTKVCLGGRNFYWALVTVAMPVKCSAQWFASQNLLEWYIYIYILSFFTDKCCINSLTSSPTSNRSCNFRLLLYFLDTLIRCGSISCSYHNNISIDPWLIVYSKRNSVHLQSMLTMLSMRLLQTFKNTASSLLFVCWAHQYPSCVCVSLSLPHPVFPLCVLYFHSGSLRGCAELSAALGCLSQAPSPPVSSSFQIFWIWIFILQKYKQLPRVHVDLVSCSSSTCVRGFCQLGLCTLEVVWLGCVCEHGEIAPFPSEILFFIYAFCSIMLSYCNYIGCSILYIQYLLHVCPSSVAFIFHCRVLPCLSQWFNKRHKWDLWYWTMSIKCIWGALKGSWSTTYLYNDTIANNFMFNVHISGYNTKMRNNRGIWQT